MATSAPGSLPAPNNLVPNFEEQLTEVFYGLRRAIHDALTACGLSPSAPQDVARKLGINRNLTWKFSKVVGSPDLFHALQHLPGDEGIGILIQAVSRAGVGGDVIERVRSAQAEFERIVRVHTSDRATLELVLDGMRRGGSSDRLEQSRKLAFRGNSGIWGVQTRVRVTSVFLAPSTGDPTKLDAALVGGMVDFRRLRPNVRWPLFRRKEYREDGSPLGADSHEEPIEPGDFSRLRGRGPMLIRSFCTPHEPPVRVVEDRLGCVYEFDEGPVGNTGASTCFFGILNRGVFERYRTPSEKFGELFSTITMPVETLLFDVVVHRDLAFALSPEVRVFGTGEGPGVSRPEIEVSERPIELMGRPPMLHSPLVPRFADLAALVFRRGGWDAREFRAIRLTMSHPPMHSTVMLKFPLPEAP